MATTFGVWDWVVFIAMLVISIGVGVYHVVRGGKKTTGELLMGSRSMGFVPVAISIIVSFQSAILILGVPAEMYTQGAMFFLSSFGYLAGGMLSSFVFVPLLYPLNLTSVYEYLELRYKSRSVRLVGSIMSIITTVLFSGFTIYAPTTALEQASGFPAWGSFLVIGIVCMFYTLLVWRTKNSCWVDTFQALIMMAGIFAVMIKAILAVGGFGEVWRLNEEWGRLNFWDFNPDPTVRHTFWSLTTAYIISTFGIIGCSQSSVQRFCATKSIKEAKRAIWLNLAGNFVFTLVACITGIAVFAYYAKEGCDPITNGDISNINQLIPYFVQELMGYPGVPGLFIACLYSGALSSISSGLSSLCAQTWEDILKPMLKEKTENQKAQIIRLLVIIYGSVGIGMTFITSNLTGTILQATLSLLGVVAGPLTGIVAMGAFFPSINWIGAISGSLISYAIMMWISIGKYAVLGEPLVLDFPTSSCDNVNFSLPIITTLPTSNVTQANGNHDVSGLERLYMVSYLWYATMGLIICVIVGLIVSFITGPTKSEEIDPKYLIRVCDWLCCCFPKSVKQCGSGAKYDVSETELQDIEKESASSEKDNLGFNNDDHSVTTVNLRTKS